MTFSGYLNVQNFPRVLEKQMRSHSSIMHTFEKTFQPTQMQRHGPIICAKPNQISFDIYTRFSLSTSPSQTKSHGVYFWCNRHIYRDMQMKQLEKAHILVEFFGFVHGTIARICKRKGGLWPPRKGNGVKFQSVVLPNGLIVNLEG